MILIIWTKQTSAAIYLKQDELPIDLDAYDVIVNGWN